jgi:transposase-like protein
MSRWTDHDRAKALAALEMNEGNVAKTAREVTVPHATITMWRDRAIEQGQTLPLSADRKTDWREVREEAGLIFLAVAREASDVVIANLRRYKAEDRVLKPHELREVATVLGINADKSFNFLIGPKGIEFNIDARSVHLPALEALSSDELR